MRISGVAALVEGYEHWHPSIAGDGDRLGVVWDDDRDGTSDISLSWFSNGAWSDDVHVPGASGSSQESHPSMTLWMATANCIWSGSSAQTRKRPPGSGTSLGGYANPTSSDVLRRNNRRVAHHGSQRMSSKALHPRFIDLGQHLGVDNL